MGAQDVFKTLQGLNKQELFSVVDTALSSQPQIRNELLETWRLEPSHLDPSSTEYFAQTHVRDLFDIRLLHVPSPQQRTQLLHALKRNDVISACDTFPSSHTRGVWGLQLDLSGHRTGPVAMRCLAEALRKSRQLLHLDLDVRGCDIQDIGVHSIAEVLFVSSRLQHLRLRLSGCGMGNEGGRALAVAMRKLQVAACLLHFDLDIEGSAIGSEIASQLIAALPSSICVLALNFSQCNVGDDVLRSFATSYPLGLLWLRLEFRGCVHISDAGMNALCAAMTPCLQELYLNALGCSLQGNSISTLAALMPRTSLRCLHINIRFQSVPVSQEALQAMREAIAKAPALSFQITL